MDSIYRDERIRKEFSKNGVIKALAFTLAMVGDIIYKIGFPSERHFAHVLIVLMLLTLIFTIYTFRKNGVNFSDIITIRKTKNKKMIYKVNNSSMAMIIFGSIFLLFYCMYVGFMFKIKYAVFEFAIFLGVIAYIIIEEKIISKKFKELSDKEIHQIVVDNESKDKVAE
ncbi:hypothetical protein IAI10_18505 [Clostridium sp. 19966]|uniref:hypothetical protein n=1 Tax=Clostridium sp. 19966 TaxID=2768166 RepID=UPI0028DEAEF8|nr:hypothetical protein [Clostridium sp. 19966]MDT8718658.1 hypothetical protein [Clostridium sp. 19966]